MCKEGGGRGGGGRGEGEAPPHPIPPLFAARSSPIAVLGTASRVQGLHHPENWAPAEQKVCHLIAPNNPSNDELSSNRIKLCTRLRRGPRSEPLQGAPSREHPRRTRPVLKRCWLSYMYRNALIVQELCESRGGRPGLSVLTSLLVSVDVKHY